MTRTLVLDAGPLVALSPLKGLAEKFYTLPEVIAELKDAKARDHYERLALTGVDVELRRPDAASLAEVVKSAKKTGDYSVLSHTDLSVLALTLSLDKEEKATPAISLDKHSVNGEKGSAEHHSLTSGNGESPKDPEDNHTSDDQSAELEVVLDDRPHKSVSFDIPGEVSDEEDEASFHHERVPLDATAPSQLSWTTPEQPLFDDPPSDEDDGEGEWITPQNVGKHKAAARQTVTTDALSKKHSEDASAVACMTTDFAMQNVLLTLGLALVDVAGKRVHTVKTWILRCHACFKLCKDPNKKFCPSCGNASLTRVAATVGVDGNLDLHLKRNFQWKNRGTMFSIPAPKPGSSKGGSRDGLILREDQQEWMRAANREEAARKREEKKFNEHGGNWLDPDWVPDLLIGKGSQRRGGLPQIGHGRKNPNERRRYKK